MMMLAVRDWIAVVAIERTPDDPVDQVLEGL